MNQPIRLSISEAARLFGINQITIRRAIKEGKLLYIVVRGRYQLNFESILKWSQESTRTKNKLEKNGIGQYVNQWRINNPLYSPNPKLISYKTHTMQMLPINNSGGVNESAVRSEAEGGKNESSHPNAIRKGGIPKVIPVETD